MTGVQQVLDRISRHDDDRYFVHRFVGWLSSADPDFVAAQLDRFETAELRASCVDVTADVVGALVDVGESDVEEQVEQHAKFCRGPR